MQAAQFLQETLDEEKKTDQLLNKLAISDVNMKAMKAAA
jgi:ferritin-like metal-binding protein YciE